MANKLNISLKQLNQKQTKFIERFDELFPNNFYTDDLQLILRSGMYSTKNASMLNKLAALYKVMKITIPNIEHTVGGIFREEHEITQNSYGVHSYGVQSHIEMHIDVVIPASYSEGAHIRYKFNCVPIDEHNYMVNHTSTDYGNFKF